MLRSRVMLSNVSCMTPFRQFIMALDVAKKWPPKYDGHLVSALCH